MISTKEFRALRRRLGETQKQFAKRFYVDQATIHRWETGNMPVRGPTRIAVEHIVKQINQ